MKKGQRDERVVWFVVPWSPLQQGGVSAVVQRLAAGMNAIPDVAASIVVNDWPSKQPQWGDDSFLRFRFQAIVADTWRATLISIGRFPVALWRTATLLHRSRVHAVNFHFADHSAVCIAVLKRLGLYRGRLLISLHGTDVRLPSSFVERVALRLSLRQATAIVACSKSLATRVTEVFSVARDRVEVVYNGADSGIFHPGALPNGLLLGAIPARFIASVGAFIPRKAHKDLVHAFALVLRRVPDMHLCLAGAAGGELEAVKSLVDALGLAARVHFHVGIAPGDVAALLAQAEVCVQPSLAESHPLAVLEAGACGTPVAASAIPGHGELIVDGETGSLFPAGDPAACAEVVLKMIADVDRTRAMAESFRWRVRTVFTWERCVSRYSELLGVGGPGALGRSEADGPAGA